MVVSRAGLSHAHETYACGGNPRLPLKLSDEVQVVLRHLRQLQMLPDKVRPWHPSKVRNGLQVGLTGVSVLVLIKVLLHW